MNIWKYRVFPNQCIYRNLLLKVWSSPKNFWCGGTHRTKVVLHGSSGPLWLGPLQIAQRMKEPNFIISMLVTTFYQLFYTLMENKIYICSMLIVFLHIPLHLCPLFKIFLVLIIHYLHICIFNTPWEKPVWIYADHFQSGPVPNEILFILPIQKKWLTLKNNGTWS